MSSVVQPFHVLPKLSGSEDAEKIFGHIMDFVCLGKLFDPHGAIGSLVVDVGQLKAEIAELFKLVNAVPELKETLVKLGFEEDMASSIAAQVQAYRTKPEHEHFARHIRSLSMQGNYLSARLKLSIKVATRSCSQANDVAIVLHLKTLDGQYTLRMSPAFLDRLLIVLDQMQLAMSRATRQLK